MEYKIYLLWAFIVIFLTYLIVIKRKFGWLPSISDSFYQWLKICDQNVAIGIFSGFLWTISILMMIIGGTNLIFLAGAGIIMVGAEPYFKDNKEGKLHYIFAILGIGLGLASMWIDFGMWYLPVIFLAGAGLLKYVFKIKNLTYWLEVFAVSLITFGLYKVVLGWIA